MNQNKTVKASTLLVLTAMLVALTGCGSNNSSNNASSTNANAPASGNNGGNAAATNNAGTTTNDGAAATTDNSGTTTNDSGATTDNAEPAAPAKDQITIKVEVNATQKDFENTDVYNEITKQTGVTMDLQTYDEEKFKLEMAGGDLPDVFQVPTKYLAQLIDGGSIMPLDDLVASNGPDIQKPTFAKSLSYSKQFWSNGTGKLYVVPVQVGKAGWGFDQQTGFNVRWDYYKELGYPEIHSVDDMVNVLGDMVAKHPKTADGKKVYGTAIWNDWGTWGLTDMGMITGNGTVANNYTDVANSGFWQTADFLYKSKKKGILDPDAFTAKYNDIVTKATQGTLLNSVATWPYQAVNADLLKEGPDHGYVTIPLDWGFAWVGGSTVAGWADRAWAISSKAKDPARAMDLINFLTSEQGSRLIASGVQGVHWDMVDGKPQMKPEIVQLAAAGGDAYKKTGIGMFANQQGMTDFSTLSDGSLVNLFDTPEVFATKVNSLNKDYDDHYGVTYPAAAYKKYADEGKVLTLDVVPQDVTAAMPAPPDDIKRIQTKLDDMMTKGIPDIVLHAKDDADYTKRQQALIKKLNDAGADKYWTWYMQAFNDTKAKFQ
ncbi:extracellular solute-binding protein [Paenibacillus rhizovicinus]|uniref:Extracellular solute-binding protein n=1 Tax=Paenibacillus rhizovicinus TaxID=2704463 RepID=A0A6C0P8G7_9BACL|nr:extracellular solute-binding protein [Paenibacillus rhizovicinus]QHW34706.1 extracellular solute-binding protein [Paenibacillus rhizovicinus]